MKELSIEEKAKAYDRALEMAKKLIENEETNVPVFYVENIKDIFPELKESEDEKNIKDLIDELKCSLRSANCQNDACGGGHEKRIALLEWGIAWLEKQKTIDVLDKEEREFADNVDSYRKDMDEFYKKGYNAGREAEKQYWLGKKSEQKDSVVDFKAKDWYVSKVDGKIHNICHSVDKVEPNF